MKTKEEILDNMNDEMPFNLPSQLQPYIHESMEIYAKQEAIAFNEFLRDNHYAKSEKGWYKTITIKESSPPNIMMQSTYYKFFTIDQIHELYLQLKLNTP